MSWIYDLENEIFTKISYRGKKKLGSDFPTIFFTMDAEPDDTTSHFPTVYIHFLPIAEQGQTLDGQEINAVLSTVQIEVSTSKDQGQKAVRQITWEIVELFKLMRYSVVMTPEIIKTGNDTNQCVARVRRMIGNADAIE